MGHRSTPSDWPNQNEFVSSSYAWVTDADKATELLGSSLAEMSLNGEYETNVTNVAQLWGANQEFPINKW